ncbi:uncharacterized protein BJ171DRAFT_582557 [Polychytrium aggregatum]|uniref:uncharacterized protein n=1 Tax=Polychytrium aggregatum TaxID=110093 RepID=UPI0022FDF24F|nr:uncharacterized protein BJ171DRAFT_582557 [Polychytrium aggregatum]KAI9203792.1 hypothetical protein BJ171DRAFT_582557 [Polychytrium aggregatum]
MSDSGAHNQPPSYYPSSEKQPLLNEAAVQRESPSSVSIVVNPIVEHTECRHRKRGCQAGKLLCWFIALWILSSLIFPHHVWSGPRFFTGNYDWPSSDIDPSKEFEEPIRFVPEARIPVYPDNDPIVADGTRLDTIALVVEGYAISTVSLRVNEDPSETNAIIESHYHVSHERCLDDISREVVNSETTLSLTIKTPNHRRSPHGRDHCVIYVAARITLPQGTKESLALSVQSTGPIDGFHNQRLRLGDLKLASVNGNINLAVSTVCDRAYEHNARRPTHDLSFVAIQESDIIATTSSIHNVNGEVSINQLSSSTASFKLVNGNLFVELVDADRIDAANVNGNVFGNFWAGSSWSAVTVNGNIKSNIYVADGNDNLALKATNTNGGIVLDVRGQAYQGTFDLKTSVGGIHVSGEVTIDSRKRRIPGESIEGHVRSGTSSQILAASSHSGSIRINFSD